MNNYYLILIIFLIYILTKNNKEQFTSIKCNNFKNENTCDDSEDCVWHPDQTKCLNFSLVGWN